MKKDKGYVYAPIPYNYKDMMNKPKYKEDVFPKCKCGKTKEKHGLCDGSHKENVTNETK